MSNNVVISGVPFDLSQGDNEVEHYLACDLERVNKLRLLSEQEASTGMNELYKELRTLSTQEIADRYLSLLDKLVEQRQAA